MLQSAAKLEASMHVFRTPLSYGYESPISPVTSFPGYPEGRRIWLNIVGRDAYGDTVFQSGAYDFERRT
jgi:hypothetical protein